MELRLVSFAAVFCQKFDRAVKITDKIMPETPALFNYPVQDYFENPLRMTVRQVLGAYILRRLQVHTEIKHDGANQNEPQVIERYFLDFVLLLLVLQFPRQALHKSVKIIFAKPSQPFGVGPHLSHYQTEMVRVAG